MCARSMTCGCLWKENKPIGVSRILSAGNDWSDFNLIAVVEHFIFCYEIVAFDHEMRFDDEVQFAQEFLDLLGAFDLDRSGWMAELDLHGRMIRPVSAGLQESIQTSARDPESFRCCPLIADDVKSPPPAEILPILPAQQD